MSLLLSNICRATIPVQVKQIQTRPGAENYEDNDTDRVCYRKRQAWLIQTSKTKAQRG